MSVDSAPSQKAFAASFGGLRFPILSDFHPKGKTAEAYGIMGDRGFSKRAVFIVDKEGVIRWAKVYDRGLPDDEEILKALEGLK